MGACAKHRPEIWDGPGCPVCKREARIKQLEALVAARAFNSELTDEQAELEEDCVANVETREGK